MITSSTNQQVKNIKKLLKSSKERNRQGVFVVEGIRMFREVPKEDLIAVFVTAEFAKKNQDIFADISYELMDEKVIKEISDTQTPQGVVAIVKQPRYELEQILTDHHNAPNGKPCLVVLENLQDPGNLGTILRTAEGAGVTGVLISKESVDVFNPKVIRSTMGAVYRIPFLYFDDIRSIITVLEENSIKTYAACLGGTDFYKEQLLDGVAFLIGNEGNGLSDESLALAQQKILIPMCGEVESLNAAIATTVLTYETMRQRLKGGIEK